MVVEFIATETGTEQDEHSVTTGVGRSDPPHYLNFGRSLPIGSEEDWGIEIEFDDQINSGYEKIGKCFIHRDRLRVELNDSIGSENQYSGFNVMVQLSEADWTGFVNGLRMVFTGQEHRLAIEDARPS
jgi:hypothetical protein